MVPPVLFSRLNVPFPELYVPPVICQSVPQNTLQRALSLVTPLTPSIDESNQASINAVPPVVDVVTVVPKSDS